MRIPKWFHFKKSRKYPIEYDRRGLSKRARCFELFEQAKRPVQVSEELKMDLPTACRYFRDWKKVGGDFETRYDYVKSLFDKRNKNRDRNLEIYAQAWQISKDQLEEILSKPHGLHGLLTGKFYSPANENIDHERHLALALAVLFATHLVKVGGHFSDCFLAIKRYLNENMKIRQDEDDEIEENNKFLAFVHQLIAADMENQRLGRVKRDRLSQEEHDVIMSWAVASEKKKMEIFYWIQKGVLIAQGLTPEQARETLYQNVVRKGDLKATNFMREFQETIDPLNGGNQSPPPSAPQPETH